MPPVLATTQMTTAPGPDPSRALFPPTLPWELALRQYGENTSRIVCEAYGIGLDEWRALCADPFFRDAVQMASDELKKDGMTFRIKARLQAEEMLKTRWRLVHDPKTPPEVAARMIKDTIREAGLDESRSQMAAGQAAIGTALQINIMVR